MEYNIGDSASITKTYTQTDVSSFSEISLDKNPLHLDKDYAKRNIFKKPICHGFLVGSLISAVLGTKLPGEGCIYLDQSMKFLRPVFWNDKITAEVEIVEILKEKNIVILETRCINQNNKIVIEGKATLMLPKK